MAIFDDQPEIRATLRARLGEPDCVALDDRAAADLLSVRPLVPNPDPAPPVPRAISGAAMLAMLSAGSFGRLVAVGLLGHFDDLAHAQARGRLIDWVVDFLLARQVVTAEESAALLAHLNATEADPSWPATVPGESWARANLGPCRFLIPAVDEPTRDGHYAVIEGYVNAEIVAAARA